MNMDGIWILHLIKFHIPNLNCVTALSPHLLPLIWTKIYYIQSPSEKRRKNITQVSANSREKDIMSGESSAKKHRVFQLTTSSCTNHIFPSVQKHFFSFRIKIKAPKFTPSSSNQNSFKLILNDSFLNIQNVKEQTKIWPQSFHDINTFLTKVFFLPIFSSHILNY